MDTDTSVTEDEDDGDKDETGRENTDRDGGRATTTETHRRETDGASRPGAGDRLREFVANSRLAAVHSSLSRTGSRVEDVAANSRIASIGATGTGYVESSYCYRWLTTEPDPDVIVIDLRETWTVGPIIRVLDRVIATLEDALETSRTARRGRQIGNEVRARPIRAASLVVLPAIVCSLLLALVAGSGASGTVVLGHLLVAGLAAVGSRSRRSLAELAETRVGQLLVEAFEPPEPPARDESRHRRQQPDRPDETSDQ